MPTDEVRNYWSDQGLFRWRIAMAWRHSGATHDREVGREPLHLTQAPRSSVRPGSCPGPRWTRAQCGGGACGWPRAATVNAARNS